MLFATQMKGTPELFQIDDIEALDVDTETDFLISESIYKATLSDKSNG